MLALQKGGGNRAVKGEARASFGTERNWRNVRKVRPGKRSEVGRKKPKYEESKALLGHVREIV